MFSRCIMSRVASCLVLCLVAWSAFGGSVLAAEGAAEAAESMKGPVWAVAYIVILLLVAMGVFATIRGSNRRDRAKPEDYSATVKH